jgi:outer membrane protein OmpA-like peptidoglycan-associated protein
MKKLILIMMVLFVSIYSYGQEKAYSNWSADLELGNSTVNDESAKSYDTYNALSHVGVGIRYNFNPKFGLGLRGGYDNLDLVAFNGDNVELQYKRINIDANVDLFKMLDLYSDWFTLQVHGGPGVGFIKTNNSYRETVAMLNGGVTGLFRIKNRSAIRLDFSTTANIAQNMTLDGTTNTSNDGVSSTIHNISVGYVYYFGKGASKGKKHADWAKNTQSTIIVSNITNENPTVYITNVIEKSCDCKYLTSEYIFFDNDKSDIKSTELNSIYKISEQLRSDKTLTLVIKGWASPTSDSAKRNLELSKNRADRVRAKYIDMGVDASRITLDYNGKDYNYSVNNVHDVARRVELILVRK